MYNKREIRFESLKTPFTRLTTWLFPMRQASFTTFQNADYLHRNAALSSLYKKN